jgi:hypothetical protein
MIQRLVEVIEWVGFVMWLGCLLRRVEASVVYVGRPSASEVLGLACSPTATPRHILPQTFYNEYMPFISLALKHAERTHEGESTVVIVSQI